MFVRARPVRFRLSVVALVSVLVAAGACGDDGGSVEACEVALDSEGEGEGEGKGGAATLRVPDQGEPTGLALRPEVSNRATG